MPETELELFSLVHILDNGNGGNRQYSHFRREWSSSAYRQRKCTVRRPEHHTIPGNGTKWNKMETGKAAKNNVQL